MSDAEVGHVVERFGQRIWITDELDQLERLEPRPQAFTITQEPYPWAAYGDFLLSRYSGSGMLSGVL